MSQRKNTSLAQNTVITAITVGTSPLESFGPAAATIALMAVLLDAVSRFDRERLLTEWLVRKPQIDSD